MNDSKYGRLYPERAVKPLREMAKSLIEDGRLTAATHDSLSRALSDLDGLGFPSDEPLFLLRAQDELAPDTVREYIGFVKDEEAAFIGNRLGAINRLYELIAQMERWEPRKLPD